MVRLPKISFKESSNSCYISHFCKRLILQALIQGLVSTWDAHSACLLTTHFFKGDLCNNRLLILTNLVNSSCAWLPMCLHHKIERKCLKPFRASIYPKKSSIISPTHIFYTMGYQGEIEHRLSLNSFTIIMWEGIHRTLPTRYTKRRPQKHCHKKGR